MHIFNKYQLQKMILFSIIFIVAETKKNTKFITFEISKNGIKFKCSFYDKKK